MTKGLQPVLANRSESAIPVLAGCINTSECVTLIYPCVLALLEPPRAFRCRRFFMILCPERHRHFLEDTAFLEADGVST